MKESDILAIPKRNNMARAHSTIVVLVCMLAQYVYLHFYIATWGLISLIFKGDFRPPPPLIQRIRRPSRVRLTVHLKQNRVPLHIIMYVEICYN